MVKAQKPANPSPGPQLLKIPPYKIPKLHTQLLLGLKLHSTSKKLHRTQTEESSYNMNAAMFKNKQCCCTLLFS